MQVEVHTPATVRAQELQQLYRGLNLTQLTVDERLDVLLHVKWTVKEFDCTLTRELVELIDREADLVNRCGYGHSWRPYGGSWVDALYTSVSGAAQSSACCALAML